MQSKIQAHLEEQKVAERLFSRIDEADDDDEKESNIGGTRGYGYRGFIAQRKFFDDSDK
jgi:hypothetical protein